MCMTSDDLGFDTAHRPGALARYFARRWLKRRGTKSEHQLIAWLLEAALGRNAMYFIERTKEYVDKWGGGGEVVPVDAFDGFMITGDPVEDTLIPHAVLVWTCMNDRPWPEEVYHDWLDKLLAAGSAEAAYLAASLWPAHDLMEKVTYRPARWLVYRGQLDAEAERLILTEMLKGKFGSRTSLYGSLEYDDLPDPEELPKQYIKRHGFTHPICGLVDLRDISSNLDLRNRIQEALNAPSWSEGVKDAAMLLYLSLKAFNALWGPEREMCDILEKNLFKLDERHMNIINFHAGKIQKIDYNLIKDYINYLTILYNKFVNNISYITLSKYISIGLKINDILYIGGRLKDRIFNLISKEKEKEKVGSWLKEQAYDLRIKDLLLTAYMIKIIYNKDFEFITKNKELENEYLDEKIENIYGKIKYIDKISLLIDQGKIYFNHDIALHKICNLIENILKKEFIINFGCNFREDYKKIIKSWHPKWSDLEKIDTFPDSNHIGLYLYYGILSKWRLEVENFSYYIKKKNNKKLYLYTRRKIIENFYTNSTYNIEINLNLYLNKIENNNLPYKELKYELINELIDIIENSFDKISKYLKYYDKLKIAKKVILSNIDLFRKKLRSSRLIELLGVDNKSQNIIMY